jgi:hypothetical protein
MESQMTVLGFALRCNSLALYLISSTSSSDSFTLCCDYVENDLEGVSEEMENTHRQDVLQHTNKDIADDETDAIDNSIKISLMDVDGRSRIGILAIETSK